VEQLPQAAPWSALEQQHERAGHHPRDGCGWSYSATFTVSTSAVAASTTVKHLGNYAA